MKRARTKKLHHKRHHKPPGISPGTLLIHASGKKPSIFLTCYNGDHFEERMVSRPSEIQPLLDNSNMVTWIDVRGLGDEAVLRELGQVFKIHPLALEDCVNSPQRPKVEDYDTHRFIIAQMVLLMGPDDMESGQLGIFLGKNYVLTIHDGGPDCLDPVRSRLQKRAGTHRKMGADYLCYTIIDAVIDHYFPVLEGYGEYLDALEEQTVTEPRRRTLHAIHSAKRELMDLRRVLWPQREMLSQLVREETPLISREVQVFIRDCYDHSIQVMDMVENYREIVGGLHDVYLSSLANRTNEVMKMLTVISTIFIPLTFIAGIYGMNFSSTVPDKNENPMNMPELYSPYGYPLTLLGMGLIAAGLLVYFWRKGWIFEGTEPDAGTTRLTEQGKLPAGPAVPYVSPLSSHKEPENQSHPLQMPPPSSSGGTQALKKPSSGRH